MRKSFKLLIANALVGFFLGGGVLLSCTDDCASVSSREEVNVSFAAEMAGAASVQTKARVSNADYNNPDLLTVIAFRETNGRYYFALSSEEMSGSKNMLVDGGANKMTWSNSNFKLEVGTYRFVAFYNLGGDLSLEYPKVARNEAKDWADIRKAILVKYSGSDNFDVNEIFAGLTEAVTLTSVDNGIAPVGMTLKRVNSRIDYRFCHKGEAGGVKENTEIPYADGNNVFGGKAVNITTTSARCMPQWSFDNTAVALTGGAYSFTTESGAGVTIGENIKDGLTATTFPTNSQEDIGLLDNIPADRIAKGAAYYRGAYVLPFVDESSSYDLDIKVVQTDNAEMVRNLKATGVKAAQNKVTYITFIFRSDDPADNIFTPNVKFDITVETVWNGIVDGGTFEI